jgi:thiosulfate/3-mercaptopyruvate sulfurtransferase
VDVPLTTIGVSVPVLITANELADLIQAQAPVRVLDVRWRLDRPDGKADYLAGHIPGAVYVDLDNQLAEHGEPTDGRHPLPTLATLQEAARSFGINPGDTVVVYDDLKNMSAARAWWLLRYAGLTDVRLLDGSLRAWTAAGFSLAEGDDPAVPGTVELDFGHLPTLALEDVADFAASGVLLDSRAPERYRGDVEPIDPRAGHIPGALNAPAPGNVDENGRFLPADELRARFLSIGVREGSPVAAYCGSGVVAAHNAVALTLAGFDPILYPGSWSQWSNHPELPVATGDAEPAADAQPAGNPDPSADAGIFSANEPAGLNPRGTVIVLGGRGETPAVYTRFGTRVAADAYRVRALGDVAGDTIATELSRAAVAALLADADLPSPKVLVGVDAGAFLAAEIAADPDSGVAALVVAGAPVGSPATSTLDWEGEVAARTACPAHQGVLGRDNNVRAGAVFTPVDAGLAEVVGSAVPVPTLAIHGEDDSISPLDGALTFYRSIPGVEIVTIAGGKHDVLNDVTHRTVAASIVLFLERVKLGSDAPLIATSR